jgi:hypothetical protein
VIKLAPAIPPGSGTGTIISAIAPGSRVVRIKVTSTVPFAANTQPDLSFVPDGAVLPLYPSRVAIYQSGLNTQLSVVTGSNATITVNPFLNSSYPAQYQVTGGGTYCQSNGGLPVGLAGSQTGVVYTLYKNGASTGVTMAGTGFAVVFPGNQPAGNYTVWGTNAAGNKEMLNSVSVNVYPTPVTNQAVPATTVSTGQSLCKDALQTLTTGGSGNNFTVNAGGSAQLVAGLKISLLPGTTVLPNGLLHAWIETGCVFCSLQKSAQMVEEISLDQTYQDTHSPTTATILRVYPNPTDGLVNIEIPDKPGDEDVSVTIWSTTGIMAAEARQFSQHTFRVDFSGMQPGLFILRIETGNHIYTARVVRL